MEKIFGKRKNLPPIILNADVLVGPNISEDETTPVDVEIFFNTFAPFRYAILSPGWTTKFIGDVSEGYTHADVNEMTKIIKQFKIQQDVTFPVRASLVVLNHKPMHLLLNQIRDKTSLFGPPVLMFMIQKTLDFFGVIPRKSSLICHKKKLMPVKAW